MKYVVTILLILFCFGLKAQKIVPNELIVRLAEGKSMNDLNQFLGQTRNPNTLQISRKLSQTEEIYLLKTNDNSPANPESIQSNPLFRDVTPSRMAELREKPNDLLYGQQWNLEIMDLESAWDITTGGQTIEGDEIVVAVLDDGFYLDLEDWGDNLYANPHEAEGDANNDGCPGNCGEDDDGDGLIDEDNMGREPGDPGYNAEFANDDDENGYIDDIHGLNAGFQSDEHREESHGTSSASIVGAKSNNEIGVASVNWDIKVLPLSSGLIESDIIETYAYITEMRRLYNETNGEKGAFIVACNYSLGVDFAFPEDFPIWCEAYDKLGEQGIISVSAVSNSNFNIDTQGDIPSLCQSDYLITATSTDVDDVFAESAFGLQNVDIAGPGELAYTVRATSDSGYGIFTGTSAAAPHIAGLIGLLYSVDCPEFISYFKENPSKVDSLAQLVIWSGDQLESLSGLVRSESRVNAFKAMIEVSKWCGGSSNEIEISNLFPNPATQDIIFDFLADPTEEIHINIYNTLGESVYALDKLFPLFQEPQGTISTRDFIPGIYFLTIQQGRSFASRKFIKL